MAVRWRHQPAHRLRHGRGVQLEQLEARIVVPDDRRAVVAGDGEERAAIAVVVDDPADHACGLGWPIVHPIGRGPPVAGERADWYAALDDRDEPRQVFGDA
jgi:hypothetical protein